MSLIKSKIFLRLTTFFTAINLFLLPSLSSAAQTDAQRCEEFKKGFSTGTGNIIEGQRVFCSASEVILFVINYILAISGIVTILFIIIGGFWYVTSAGSEEQAEKGRKIIINSVIGLVVILMSAAIVRIISTTLK